MRWILAIVFGLAALFVPVQRSAAEGVITVCPSVKSVVKNPSSLALGSDGRLYVTDMGELGGEGKGQVAVIVAGTPTVFADGLNNPRGLVAFQNLLFVADNKQIWRIDNQGRVSVYAAANGFSPAPGCLTDLAVDESGLLYASDEAGAIYRIDKRGKGMLVTNAQKTPLIGQPGSLVMDGMSFLIVRDTIRQRLIRVRVADGTAMEMVANIGKGRGLLWDKYGRLFGAGGGEDRLFVIPRPDQAPIAIRGPMLAPNDICLDKTSRMICQLSADTGSILASTARVPGQEVNDNPLPLRPVVAFPDLTWTGWKPENDRGQVIPLRPVLLTNAGDGSNRVFVATEQGVVHVFANDPKATKTSVFLDVQDRVKYNDRENEEGFLGLAFHPDFKKNGEFFTFYTLKQPRFTNVIMRYRVSKDDPNRADPASGEEILRITKHNWNHDGGTIIFGPDGFLYIAAGDGGGFNDIPNNAQNLNKLMGKILRIDVNNKEGGKNYAIPKDNPFVSRKDALPEIYAYGIRNVWRMAFDRKTGRLWAADVGQNLYEEVDFIDKGGNYGWRLREGLHPFNLTNVTTVPSVIEPIWEYNHDVGKSITGGSVYRGKKLPELEGKYLCADYVSGKIWALTYDDEKKRVTGFNPIPSDPIPVMSFGEDENGEIYFMTYSTSGKGLYRFERSTPGEGAK
jgi:glucose/arabinose dehydrogenase